MADEQRPNLRATVSNWRTYPAPLTRKLRMAASNNWERVRRRSDCCGHPGQPGC